MLTTIWLDLGWPRAVAQGYSYNIDLEQCSKEFTELVSNIELGFGWLRALAGVTITKLGWNNFQRNLLSWGVKLSWIGWLAQGYNYKIGLE